MIPVQQAFAQAFAHEAAGRADQAAAIYRQVLVALPDHPGALLKLAEYELAQRRFDDAREHIVRALTVAERQDQPTGDLWLTLGGIEMAIHDPVTAEACFRRAGVASTLGAPARANLALALAAQLRWAEACEAAGQATAIPGAPAHAFQVAAYVELKAGNAVEAIAIAREGLLRFPEDGDLILRLVDALRVTSRVAEARKVLEAALTEGEDHAELHSALGAVLLQQGEPASAREALRRATRTGVVAATTWDNLGVAERALGNHSAAIGAFGEALRADPLLTTAATHRMKAQQEICAWDDVAASWTAWRSLASRPDADPRCNPFVALGLPTSAEEQLAIARRWSRHMLPPVAPAFVRARGDRLRVGYLSGDLHAHATAYLMAGLFECHDRQRFAVHIYSHGPDDRSAIRGRIQAAAEAWVDVSTMDDDSAARRMRDDRLDVLVDLKGHTQDARLGILARRPAPCQLHYLGFPGTLGTDAIDAIVADDIVVPAGDERHFHERVLRLPRCYQVNDHRRELPPPLPRAKLGLPEHAVVLCCFNQSYKLGREFFGLWLDALRTVPGAVLWLYVPLPLARRNLLAEATRAGIEASRIVFADRVEPATHIARLRAADLVLDQLPYGSHTTGSDALWAGVPMISCRGNTFAGRVGASLLHAVGLDQLVAETPAQYGDMLLRLAADREALAGHRDHLERERMRLPLFDTAGFTRDWEALLVGAFDRGSTATDRRDA